MNAMDPPITSDSTNTDLPALRVKPIFPTIRNSTLFPSQTDQRAMFHFRRKTLFFRLALRLTATFALNEVDWNRNPLSVSTTPFAFARAHQ